MLQINYNPTYSKALTASLLFTIFSKNLTMLLESYYRIEITCNKGDSFTVIWRHMVK